MDTTAKSIHSHVCVRAKTHTKHLDILHVEVMNMYNTCKHVLYVCMY